MDKEYKKILDNIHASSEDFNNYLIELLPKEIQTLVNKLMSLTEVYLFSGIIRDYFVNKKNTFRDIDFVIEDDLDIDSLFPNLIIKRNSFGGYKMLIDSISIDLWCIKNTWGLSIFGGLPFALNLPDTTFFNASSILFSLNDKKFIVGKPFLAFLKNKEMDIVLEDNPEPALCIVNAFHYYKKYNLNFSKKLQRYIKNYNVSSDELETVQQKHFKEIIYSTDELLRYKQSFS